MKFLADMGISPKSAAFLRSLGYDAVHYNEHVKKIMDGKAINRVIVVSQKLVNIVVK